MGDGRGRGRGMECWLGDENFATVWFGAPGGWIVVVWGGGLAL